MKAAINVSAGILAIATLASAQVPPPSRTGVRCTIENSGTLFTTWSLDPVPDIPGICGGLWDNLNGYANCFVLGLSSCEDVGDGILEWKFSSPYCLDQVNAAWYAATKNQWGHIDCNSL